MKNQISKARLVAITIVLMVILGAVIYVNAQASASPSQPFGQVTTVTQTVTATQVFDDDAIQVELEYQFIGNATMRLNLTQLIIYAMNPQTSTVPTDQFYEVRADQINLNVKILVNDVDAIIAAIKAFLEPAPPTP